MSPGDRGKDAWTGGDMYEPYVGRWSRLVAREFLPWLAVLPGSRWLDVGCGTGALTQTILREMSPRAVTGIDLSEAYIAYARRQVVDERVSFVIGDAQALPLETGSYDAAVSALALNFMPSPAQALAEMVRVVRSGGVVGAYVWDYAGEMQLMRYFWDAAALDSAAVELDEGRRFPLCRPEPLQQLFQSARLRDIRLRPIDVPTVFRDFDDYWSPFLGGQGPAPGYAMSLGEEQRERLRALIHSRLPVADDGSIHLIARAWAVCGIVAIQ